MMRSVLSKGDNDEEMKTLEGLLEDQVVKFGVNAVCGYLDEKGDHTARKWLQQFHNSHDVHAVGLIDFFDAMCHGKEVMGGLYGRSGSSGIAKVADPGAMIRMASFGEDDLDAVNCPRVSVLVLRAMDIIRSEIMRDMHKIKSENEECVRIAAIWLQDGEEEANRARRPVAGTLPVYPDPLDSKGTEIRLEGFDTRSNTAVAHMALLQAGDLELSSREGIFSQTARVGLEEAQAGAGTEPYSDLSTENRDVNFRFINAMLTSYVVDLVRDRLVGGNHFHVLHFFDNFMESLVNGEVDGVSDDATDTIIKV